MIYLLYGLLAALAAMCLAPDAPLSRQIRRVLIEGPRAWAARQKPARVIVWTLFIGILVALLIWSPDVLRAVGMLFAGGADVALPLIAALIDGSVALELLIAAWLAASSGALKGLWRLILRTADAVSRLAAGAIRIARRQRPRTRKTRGSQTPRKPDDSAPEPGWAFA